MNSEDSTPKVPPLRIKNVRSLQTVHISDEDEDDDDENENDEEEATEEQQQSSGNDSGSDNENLVIDESQGAEPEGDECMVIEDTGDESGDEVELDPVTGKFTSRRQSISSDGASLRAETTPTMQNSAAAATSSSSRSSRRKSHHVPKQVGDVVFEEATITILPDPEPATSSDREDVNKYLMKNIAMLKSCINYALEQQNYRPMTFKYNYENTSKLIEQYKQIKKSDLNS